VEVSCFFRLEVFRSSKLPFFFFSCISFFLFCVYKLLHTFDIQYNVSTVEEATGPRNQIFSPMPAKDLTFRDTKKMRRVFLPCAT